MWLIEPLATSKEGSAEGSGSAMARRGFNPTVLVYMVIRSCMLFHLHGNCESPCKLHLHGDSAAHLNHHVNIIYMVIHRSLPPCKCVYMVNQVSTHVNPFTWGNALATM